jgi:hypothetical protein
MVDRKAVLAVAENSADFSDNIDMFTKYETCESGWSNRKATNHQDIYIEETTPNSCAVPANRGADPTDRSTWNDKFSSV